MTLEKRGIWEGETDFANQLSLTTRIEDHLLLMQELNAGAFPGWDKRVAIIGQGDGGRIGAHLATLLPNVRALALIGSGGAWPAKEELLVSFRSDMARCGFSPQYIHGFLVKARQEFEQAQKSSDPKYHAFGYTYMYWNSLLKLDLLQDLSNVRCPIFSMHGLKDDRVPIESVQELKKQLSKKDTISFVLKENAGREVAQDFLSYEEVASWLRSLR